MRTLALTSPHMHGPDVLALQWLLHQRGYLKDKADGEYGQLTAQAVYRAKFWLGYRKPDHSAGGLLVAYLKHERKPTPGMAARAVTRRRRKAATPLRVKALANMKKHLGEKEHPSGSNRMPWASEWYMGVSTAWSAKHWTTQTPGPPWCAMAVTRAYVDAGSKAFAPGNHYAYVPFIVNDARGGFNNLAVTNHPEPGDIACYDWERNGVADHVGLFESWIAGGEGVELLADEGNTSVASDSNGGEVMRRTRKRSQVQAFVHVGR
jgi:peptidoglycan hydrolase-like protein with peptidoglycan-binding domain